MTPEPIIEISYTLRGSNGSFESVSVQAAQVPRIDDIVTFDHGNSYQVVDVLWKARHGEQWAVITAYERDWHEHIEDTLQDRDEASLSPADARHLIDLMHLINWNSEQQSEDTTDSAIPDALNQILDAERGVMLANALLDWDIIRNRKAGRESDALFRLAVVYTMPVFEGAPAEVDHALGELLSSVSHPKCESPGAVEGLGRRWREDLCATAWRLVLAYRKRERDR